VGFEAAFKGIESLSILENPMDQHCSFKPWFDGLRLAGDGGGEDAGEQVEKSGGDHFSG
jgi:hypothetical protein